MREPAQERLPEPLWHAHTVTATVAALAAPAEGLSSAEAQARLTRHGKNALDPPAPPSSWRILLHQLTSPLIYVLLGAGALALLLGEHTDAGFIAAVVLIDAALGFFHERRAERSIQALAALVRTTARVQRDGRLVEVDGTLLVPGDRVLLESGNRVPADLRLVALHGLRVDESLLTGESRPVEKRTIEPLAADTALAERGNLAFAGSMVVSGRGEGVVVATGKRTEVGRIAGEVATAGRQPTPLVVRMQRFARTVGIAVVVVAAFVVAIGFWHGQPTNEVLLGAVALAVSAIPEGLPVALTIALAVAVSRLVQRGVVVRHLPAVEGLGSCTVIATDKTGTLTKNQLTVERVEVGEQAFAVDGAGYEPLGQVAAGATPVRADRAQGLARLLRAAVLTNEGALDRGGPGESWVWSGDPTDVALLSLARKAGVDPAAVRAAHTGLAAMPFEPEHRYSASLHRLGERRLLCVKGAPERVLAACTSRLAADGSRAPLDHAAAEAQVAAMMASGLRVLAIADREGDADMALDAGTPLRELCHLGLVGMTDPPRPGVPQAIAACRRAGIDVAMITGDHPITAVTIAARIGLASDSATALTGSDVQALDDAALSERLANVRIFARATPDDKLRIVRAYQRRGAFVAVTGDGVNDAPALRQANLGVAMGRTGTDVAREAADLVLTEDDFTSIVAGVEEGRIAYDNVRKVTFLLVSTGTAEVLLVTAAILVGMPAPFAAAQLLWLNLVTNGIQDVALAFEPGEKGVLDRPPRRPGEGVLDRIMVERVLVSGLTMAAIGLFCWSHWTEHEPSVAEARTKMVHLFVLFEILHVGNARSESVSMFRLHPLQNPLLLYGSATAFLLHLVATYVPATADVLGLVPITLVEWLELTALALPIVVVMELHKRWRSRTAARA